jgi:arginase
MKTVLFGACTDLGCHIDGARRGPEKLIHDVMDYKDESVVVKQNPDCVKSKDPDDKRKNAKDINAFDEKLYNAILKEVKQGSFPIMIGGDHSAAVASALASQKVNGDLGIIWIDAHTDFNTPASTETGNVHGFPLACIDGYQCEEFRTFFDGKCISPAKTVVVCARSIDPAEAVNVKDAGITVISAEEVKSRGVQSVMEEAFRIAGGDNGKIHISYDIDGIDGGEVPGVSTPVSDGPSTEQGLEINKYIIDHFDRVSSCDLVEFNPDNDINEKTEKTAVNLLAGMIEAAHKKQD